MPNAVEEQAEFSLAILGLYERIREEFRHAKVAIRTIGNGEEVVIVNSRLFVWDIEDWERLTHDPDTRIEKA
jgi:hypothetical protein